MIGREGTGHDQSQVPCIHTAPCKNYLRSTFPALSPYFFPFSPDMLVIFIAKLVVFGSVILRIACICRRACICRGCGGRARGHSLRRRVATTIVVKLALCVGGVWTAAVLADTVELRTIHDNDWWCASVAEVFVQCTCDDCDVGA
jgi:hypothetical protein